MCFQSVYSSSPETWTQPQQQSWCNQSNPTAHLSLPLLSEKTEMWSAQPLLPLARINQCLQIQSEILVLIASSIIVKEPLTVLSWAGDCSSSQRLPFLLWMSMSSTPPTCFVLCTGVWAFTTDTTWSFSLQGCLAMQIPFVTISF